MAYRVNLLIVPEEHADPAFAQDKPVIVLGPDGVPLAAEDEASRVDPGLFPEPDGDDVAYVVFTSGSTGEPKGVIVGRGQLAWSTSARFAYYRDHPTSFLLLSSLAVDSSVAGVYWTLCAGGTLVLPGPRAEQDLDALADLIEEASVTHTLVLPSLYRAMLEHVRPERLSSVRLVVVAGESCPATVVDMHAKTLPEIELHNEYGPSEATVWASVAELTADPEGPVTIGRPAQARTSIFSTPTFETCRPARKVRSASVAQGWPRVTWICPT